MPSKRKYSFPYRVYRKIRYLRYVSRLRNAERKDLARTERNIIFERKRLSREQKRSERSEDRLKRRQERLAIREIRKKLRSDQEQDYAQNKEVYEEELRRRLSARKKSNKFRRYRRRRLTRFYLKALFRNTLLSLKTLNPANLPKLYNYIRENKINIREFAIICLQSTMMFVASYLAVLLVLMGTEAISGVFFNYSSIIYYNKVLWLVKPEEWYQDSVQMIYASGPVLCGILAVFFAIIFSYMYTERILAKIFILWFVLHAFNAFFGALLIGSLFDRGIGYAILWSYISDTEKVIFSIVSILALFLLGVFTTRSFLISANIYYPQLEKSKHQAFIWAQLLLPFLVGNAFIGLIMLPDVDWFDIAVALSLTITIIPIAIGYRFLPSLFFEEGKTSVQLKLRAIALAIAFIVLFRIILGIGIRIG
jgi:hypothetical protein